MKKETYMFTYEQINKADTANKISNEQLNNQINNLPILLIVAETASHDTCNNP